MGCPELSGWEQTLDQNDNTWTTRHAFSSPACPSPCGHAPPHLVHCLPVQHMHRLAAPVSTPARDCTVQAAPPQPVTAPAPRLGFRHPICPETPAVPRLQLVACPRPGSCSTRPGVCRALDCSPRTPAQAAASPVQARSVIVSFSGQRSGLACDTPATLSFSCSGFCVSFVPYGNCTRVFAMKKRRPRQAQATEALLIEQTSLDHARCQINHWMCPARH